MISASLKIEGAADFAKALKAMADETSTRGARAALYAAGHVVRKAASAMAPELQTPDPRRTRGLLKRSIKVGRQRGPDGFMSVAVRVRGASKAQIKSHKDAGGKSSANPNDPYYWKWVEFGTVTQPARPFMRPGFESTKDAQIAAMRQRLAAYIKKHGGSGGT